MFRNIAGLVLCLALLPVVAQAQVHSVGVIDQATARRAGLERVWYTQLQFDPGQGRMAGLTQHVSASRAHTVIEILHAGRRFQFSERDLDPFGKPVGVEGAKKSAEKKLGELKDELTRLNPAAPPAADKLPVTTSHITPEITLCAASERGGVHLFDAETGRTLWSCMVGDASYPTTAAFANDDYVAVANGSTLYVLNALDGSLQWQRRLPSAPAGGPGISEDMIFITLVNGMMQAYKLEESKPPVKSFHSYGSPMGAPTVLHNSVSWATDRGHLYVGDVVTGEMQFRIEAKAPIQARAAYLAPARTSPKVMLPDRLVVTSQDGYVYCVDEFRGGILWRHSTGDRISQSPVIVNDLVYAVTDAGDLVLLDGEDGTEKWVISGIRGIISGNSDRLYCTDLVGGIAVLDAKTGSRIASLPVSSLDVRMVNYETDRIFIGNSSGLIQCLRETARYWPEVRSNLEAVAKKPVKPTKPTDKPAAKPAAGKEPAAEGDDPFAPGDKKPAKEGDPEMKKEDGAEKKMEDEKDK